MTPLVVPVAVASGLLAVAGAAKVITPEPTASALRTMRLPEHPWAVRLIGLGEMVLGVLALAVGGRALATMLGLAYFAFAAFVLVALRRGDVASCGCFGRVEVPPGPLHVVVNAALGVAALGAAIIGMPDLASVLDDQPAFGLPYLGLTALVGWGLYLVLTLLPAVAHRHATTAAVVPQFSLRPSPRKAQR